MRLVGMDLVGAAIVFEDFCSDVSFLIVRAHGLQLAHRKAIAARAVLDEAADLVLFDARFHVLLDELHVPARYLLHTLLSVLFEGAGHVTEMLVVVVAVV